MTVGPLSNREVRIRFCAIGNRRLGSQSCIERENVSRVEASAEGKCDILCLLTSTEVDAGRKLNRQIACRQSNGLRRSRGQIKSHGRLAGGPKDR